MTPANNHPLDPPVLDMLHLDEDRSAFVVTFVPSDDVSDEPKLVVTIPSDSVEGRHIRTWLDQFRELLSNRQPVVRIVHSGGGDYLFAFADGTTRELCDSPLDNAQTQTICDGLQYVSQAAENAYRIVQVNLVRTA